LLEEDVLKRKKRGKKEFFSRSARKDGPRTTRTERVDRGKKKGRLFEKSPEGKGCSTG